MLSGSDLISFWKLDEFSSLINDFDEAIGNAIREKDIEQKEDFNHILLHIAGKSIVSAREIICLCSNGFADGAMSLARTVYEHSIILLFFYQRLNDLDFHEYIEDFFLDYKRKYQKYYKTVAEELKLDDLKKQVDSSVENRKRKAHHPENGDYWWSGKGNFYNVVQDVHSNLDDSVKTVFLRAFLLYKQACLFVHSNSFGNMWRLSAEGEYEGINTCPSEKGHSLPLEFAALSIICISFVVCMHLNLEFTALQNGFNKLATYYVTITNERPKQNKSFI
jgi:hypothetical protein